MKKHIDDFAVHEQHYNEIRTIMEQEPYAQFIGMKLIDFGPGTATAELVPTENMLNAHNTVHGAVLFSLADYVFAVASNSYGKTAVGVTDAPITFEHQVKVQFRISSQCTILVELKIPFKSASALGDASRHKPNRCTFKSYSFVSPCKAPSLYFHMYSDVQHIESSFIY